MDESKKAKVIADVDARLMRIVQTMPADLVAEARNLSEVDLLAETGRKLCDHLMRTMAMLAAALSRCGVCRAAEDTCAHCVAINMEVVEIMQEAFVIATITKAATGPGSRIAAQREARAETVAKPMSMRARTSSA